MAERCTLGNHGFCIACSGPVGAFDKGHIHHFRGRGHGTVTLCSTCSDIAFIAANFILQCVRETSQDRWSASELQNFLNDHVSVGIDVPLFDPREFLN